MGRDERLASPAEVRDAIARGYREWTPRLLRYAARFTHGDTPRAHDLVDRAYASVLEPNGRKWPIDRVPRLESVIRLGIKSFALNEHAASRVARLGGADAVPADEVPDSSRGVEKMTAVALHDDEVAAVVARARALLEGDECALVMLAVLEGDERDDATLEREAKRTGQTLFVVTKLARRRMGRALQRAHAEVKKS